MKKALFPGTFETWHKGHYDVVRRTLELFDEVVIGLGVNDDKPKPIFSIQERMEMIKRSLAAYLGFRSRVKVVSYEGLLVNFAYKNGFTIVRGVRPDQKNVLEEIVLYQGSETQNLPFEVLLFPARKEFSDLSSTLVKVIQKNQGFVHEMVPLYIKQRLEGRISGQYIIGVTGEIGTGKSHICRELEELGRKLGYPVNHIELDHTVHKITDKTLQGEPYDQACAKIVETFGKEVESPDGKINRKALGDIVFNDSEKMKQLNEILKTPMIFALKQEIFNKKGLILINAALGPDLGLGYLYNNNTVLVSTDKASQEKRLRERNLTEEQIKRRIQSQYNTEQKKAKIHSQISEQKQGKLWVFNNPDGSHSSKVSRLFNNMIQYIDLDGQLRFYALWNRIEADGTPNETYGRLLEAHNQPYRFWHTFKEHITPGLNYFPRIKRYLENSDQYLMSLFLHDFFMAEKSRVNEERSAEMAYIICKNALLSGDFCNGVKDNILATKHHGIPPKNDQRYLCDQDLMIFGAPEKQFDWYCYLIRREFAYEPFVRYQPGRTHVMQGFLDRANNDNLYGTDHFRELCGPRAPINLQREIDRIGRGIDSLQWNI